MPKKWINKKFCEPSVELVSFVGSKLLATLLVQRGIDTVDKAQKFLNPLEFEPISPYVFVDMEKAVNRIKTAIDEQQHIVICGDFDADGVTSTAVMHKTLKHLGANFSHYIPDRQTESHGLSSAVLLRKISKEQAKLFITVDCAISDFEEVSLANSFGADVIITDHHEAKNELPNAYAIIDPKAQNSLRDDLSLEQINSLSSMAGVGVAFKLACALLEEYGKIELVEELLPLVALGTVADIMPLLHENRLFVTMGLKLIQEGKNLGLKYLLQNAGVGDDEEITADKIAFTLAPRINAAGRLDSAETAFSLLIGETPSELIIHAQTLSNFNKIRQELAETIYQQALEYIETSNGKNEAAIVAYNPEWHIGIIGIVASRLTEKFNKPVFMFTDSPDGQLYRSSARSVEGINIFNALEINADIIKSYGGHSMAAGLALDKNEITIETFKEAINKTILEMSDGIIPEPELQIDLNVTLSDLTPDLLSDLKRLEPCGEGNPFPLFSVRGLNLQSERVVGQNNNHLKFSCSDSNLEVADCVFWKHTSLHVPIGKSLDLAFYPKLNEFNGVKSIQLEVQDYNSEFINLSNECQIKVIDHRKKIGILEQVAEYIKNSSQKFKIFAEDKSIVSEISSQNIISQNIVTRLNVENTDQLMLFDYPADEELMKFILNAAKPRVVHVMNYKTPIPDIDALVSKISGMMKYAANKYSGIVYIPDISTALSVTDALTTLVIKLLNRTNVIKVNDFKNGEVYFDFIEAVSVEKIKSHEVYEKCRMELFKSKNYRETIVNAQDLSRFVS